MDCGTCDMEKTTGGAVDCANCPCGSEPVDLIGDELRDLSDDELTEAIGLD